MAASGIAVVVPFYNEANFLGATLQCLKTQHVAPHQIVLVNNGSTDQSREIALQFCQEYGETCTLVDEPTPGKVHALKAGCAKVECAWTTTLDADTFYPDDYLATITTLAASAPHDCVAIMALGLPKDGPEREAIINDRLALHHRFPRKCFVGGHGQTFRTDVLRAVGGFDEAIWPYVLMDHEIVHRMHSRGSSLYSEKLWCSPAERRVDRGRVRWTAFERMIYRNVPYRFEDWFFYTFLARRFQRRNLRHINLRAQPWEQKAN